MISMSSKKLLQQCTYALPILLLPTYIFSATYDVNQLRENAVVLVRQGQTNEGLKQLKALFQQYPNDQKVLADYWLVSYQQNQLSDDELKDLVAHIQLQNFPNYAYLAVIHSLRDHKQFNEALVFAQNFDAITPNNDFKLLQGVLWAELQQDKQANQLLDTIPKSQLAADQLSLMAYAYRIINNNIASLDTIRMAYALAPQKIEIQEQYLTALFATNSYHEARTFLQQTKLAEVKPQLNHALILQQFSQNIKDAISRYKYLSNHGESDENSFTYLDEVLANAPTDMAQLDQNSSDYLRFNYDYIYALNFRGRSSDVIALKNQFALTITNTPAYVRHSIADSYLALKQLKQAEQWYSSLLNEKNYPDMTVYSGLYFAYIEQEKYQQANQFLKQIDAKIARYRYSNAVGVNPIPTDDRQEYIRLLGMNLAYANRLNNAEKYYADLLEKAPNNVAYINSITTILRWREQPLTAQKMLDRLTGITPVDKATQINSAQNSQALGNIQQWHQQLTALVNDYPQDSSVIENHKQWLDRSHASISYQTDFGHSHTNQTSQSLKGTRDRNAELRINSPWLKDNYRVFAVHQDYTSQYHQENIREQRYGVGVEWASQRKDLNVSLTQNTDQARTGIDIDWSHWLNDHWQYGLGFNSQASIPLQAIDDNEHGQQYVFNLLWQQNESRNVHFGYQLTDISDGNKQNEWFLNYSQRVFASPHHTTQATLANYFAKNSQQDVSYFSPKTQYGSDLTITHDWLTWRKYNQSFTQHFEAGVGFFSQHDYSTKPTWNLQYAHQWSLSRTWQLNYGVGIASHPYDGKSERRTYGLFGFQGIF